MVKLKKMVMKKHDCIYCKYYKKWTCLLDHCFLETEIVDESGCMAGCVEHDQPNEKQTNTGMN